MPDPTQSPDVERYRRVAAGVRKKLVGMALEHSRKHDDMKNELMTHAAKAEGADTEAPLDQNGAESEHQPNDMMGHQPAKDTMKGLPSQAEQSKMHSEQRDDRRSAEQSEDMSSLGAAAQAKPSGAEDHGWAEHETDAEHAAEPDPEREVAEDPGEGEDKWQMSNRKIGKTAKGIIGAYRKGK
jgi:hypothetical protein